MTDREVIQAALDYWDAHPPGADGALPWLAPLLDLVANTATGEVRLHPCPDGGTCHHECPVNACFRVHNAGPLSDIFVGDDWPRHVRANWANGGHL